MDYVSHVGQDRWVAEVLDQKREGYFLDFGAFDGVIISNTLYLERELGWRGICVEPNPRYYPNVCAERRVISVNNALWPVSGEIVNLVDAHGLSSLEAYAGSDKHAEIRAKCPSVPIETLNPTQLLDRFKAPPVIDYLSLDVEGCEFEILSAIDLDRYKILLMTIEHNHQELKKSRIREYVAARGYGVVQNKNDDFFFRLDGEYELDPAEHAARVDREYRVRA